MGARAGSFDTRSHEHIVAALPPEMALMTRAKDWSLTPLGDRKTWSPALRTILDVTLASRFPAVFWWGPDLLQFYNDAYRVILGAKHPRSLGQPGAECWAEIWHIVGPQIESVFAGAPSTYNEDRLLEVNRYGYVEETYFTFSYSAVPDEEAPNGIGGVLGTVQETTQKVIGERRMRLLRDLAARAGETRSVNEECRVAVDILERDAADVPFALIYLNERSEDVARLCAAAGVESGVPESPQTIPLDGAGPWNLSRTDGVTLIDHHGRQAVVATIPSSVPHESAGFLIGGISPKLRFDERYRDFYALVAAQIGTAIAGARIHEEERRRAEALAEIDRAKNVFFSNVSHEFRTPLTLMLGPLAELAKNADEASRPLVDAAHRNSLRLLKLVNTLLEFSRIEAGRADAVFVKTDLGALTGELCSLFRSAIDAAGLEFEIDIRLSQEVYVDRAMWERILLNLLSNALKFTMEGSIRVTLRESGEAAELCVEDTGAGIAEEELPHIFERFRRVRGARARSHEGSGIGLALVKDLVELHGGSIAARSEVDRGTAFTVRLPFGSGHLDAVRVLEDTDAPAHSSSIVEQYLADVDATITRAATPLAEAPASGGQLRKRILLADDNGDLRDYITRLLSPLYEVIAVRNGAEALAVARERHVDLIVSDVMMPEMDGFELLNAVRAEAALSTTPFIILSARAAEESALEGLTRGADDYIAKPFSAEELLGRVHANLNAAAVREEAWQVSLTRFRAFADRLPMMVWQQDASGAFVFANTAWYNLTRLPRDPSSFTPDVWRRVIHPTDYERVLALIDDAARSRGAFSFEYRVKAADADEEGYRWYVASAEPQYSGDEFAGWTGYVADIHDARMREDVERTLRRYATEREQAFHALAEAVPVIVWSADASGWVDWYNKHWYSYTGQTPEDASGWGWQAAHHPDDFPRVMQEWPRCIATGERFEMEFRLRRNDGVFHWFLTRAEPQKDDAGRVIRWYGSNVDIQAQKEALDQSKRIAETLQGVFLPEALPHTPKVRFDAVYVAAGKDALIGGDWFDAAQLPDGRFLVSIGDVAGHGLDASVIAGTLRHAVTGLALNDEDPAQILQYANRILCFQHPGKYATALVGIIDRDCTSLAYACAGHPPPILADVKGAPGRALPHSGLPLGVQPELHLSTHVTSLAPDGVLAFYTDGLVEFARDMKAAEEKLAQVAGDLVGDTSTARPAVAVQKAVLADAVPVDDVAILVAQFSNVKNEVLGADPSSLKKEWRFHSSDAYSARSSRRELMKFIRRFAEEPDSLFATELVVGEVLANTVEHAPGLVEIQLDWIGEKPVMTVRDTGPGMNSGRCELPQNALAENGRGLFLINALAQEVSVRRAPGYGAEIRAVLPVTRRIPNTNSLT